MTLSMTNTHLMRRTMPIYQIYQRKPKLNMIVMTNLMMKKITMIIMIEMIIQRQGKSKDQ